MVNGKYINNPRCVAKAALTKETRVRISTTPEERAEWVRLFEESGKISAEFRRELGLAETTFAVWRKQERGPAAAEMILHRLHQRLSQKSLTALPKSEPGKACTYALGRWTKLTRYVQPGLGHIEIDNNRVENGIRPTALGLKKWLFVGYPDAGWIAVVIYSVVGTCKLLRPDPEAYLN
jgi:hypothetical protein